VTAAHLCESLETRDNGAMSVFMFTLGLVVMAAAPEPTRPVFAGVATRGAADAAAVELVRIELARLCAERGVKVVVPIAIAVTEQKKARAIAELDERLDAAAVAFKRRDWGEARTAAVEALTIFEEKLAYTDDDAGWARYRELLLLVADAQLSASDRTAADETLGQLLVIEPDHQPTKAVAARLSAGLLERLALVKDTQRATPRTTLEVKSRPPGARVLVDGRSAGRAPVAIDVLPGIHYVLVDDEGRLHTERVVVGPDGARVTARLGSPEAEAAARLMTLLKEPLGKRDLTEAAADVADVTLAALVVPWGPTVQVLIARVTDGELDAVFGARLPRQEGPRETALFQLVDAALTRSKDGWVGAGDDAASLRQALLQGVGDPGAKVVDEDEPLHIPLLVGGIVGGVVIVAGAATGTVLFLQSEAQKDEGFRYVVDTSSF
jgi:hypothetical protein